MTEKFLTAIRWLRSDNRKSKTAVSKSNNRRGHETHNADFRDRILMALVVMCSYGSGAAAGESPAHRVPARFPHFRGRWPHRGVPPGSPRTRLRRGQKYRHRVAICGGKPERRGELAAELVRLKVDVIVSAGPTVTRACQGSNSDDSDCHGAGYRPGRQRVRRKLGAAGWKHYWVGNPCPGG